MASFQAYKVSAGDTVEYTPTVDTPAGTVVVQNGLVGITTFFIPANTLGALAVYGVFDIVKATTTGSGMAVGTPVYWDNTNLVATSTATNNTYIGKCVKACADSDTTVRVRLVQS